MILENRPSELYFFFMPYPNQHNARYIVTSKLLKGVQFFSYFVFEISKPYQH